MNYRVLGGGARKVLVVRPREDSYGHQVIEILMGLHLASHLGAAVCYRRPHRVASRALFRLTCREVPVLNGPRAVVARARARAAETLQDAAARLRRVREQRSGQAIKGRKRKLPPPDFLGLDFRERYARHPMTVSLPEHVSSTAARQAQALGLSSNTRVVTLHARESGFKAASGGESEADAIRNARIESYRDAIDWLVSHGCTVVRIGDRMMTPFHRHGLIDLATSPARTDELELWMLMRSDFLLACDSGPYCATFLTNTPCLAVNVTNVIGAYPIHGCDRYMLKRVFDRRLGRVLTLTEMLTDEYFEQRKDLRRYQVMDNTPEEIREAVEEMLRVLAGTATVGESQHRFRRLAERLQNSPVVAARRTKKGEPARQFLGDGFVARSFAERYL